MKRHSIAILLVLVVLTGCVTKKIKYDVDIPEMDNKGYSDEFFKEGWEQLKIGKIDLAYEKFKESNSKDYKLYNAFGYVYLLKNKPSNALRNFKKSLKLKEDNVQAEYGLAMIREIGNDIKGAFKIYSEIILKYPDSEWAKKKYKLIKDRETKIHLENAEKYLMANKDENYIKSLKLASEYSPEKTELKVKIGEYYYNKNNFEKASEYFEYALESNPEDIEIMRKLAGSYENGENINSAIIIYKRLLNLLPEDLSITNKINDLKIKFQEIDLPVKFKDIFFKDNINREELAALIGHYFKKYLFFEGQPVILTDIKGSFAKDHIIKVCSSGIIKGSPNHRFNRFKLITRAFFSTVATSLLKYLKEKSGLELYFTPLVNKPEPTDISPLHKDYKKIMFLLNSQILYLDDEGNFNPTEQISPSDVMISLRKILKSIPE